MPPGLQPAGRQQQADAREQRQQRTCGSPAARRGRWRKLMEPVVRAPVNISTFGVYKAGARPNKTPQNSDAANPNRSTRRSSDAEARYGIPAGAMATNVRSRRTARMHPATPPPRLSSSVSASVCRIMRDRPAPSATRTASSCRRAMDRANSRFAALAQATRSMARTAASSVHDATRKSPVRRSRRPRTWDSACSRMCGGSSSKICRAGAIRASRA